MQVKSIAECSPWSILQYFWPAISNNWLALKTNFQYYWQRPFYTGFTVHEIMSFQCGFGASHWRWYVIHLTYYAYCVKRRVQRILTIDFMLLSLGRCWNVWKGSLLCCVTQGWVCISDSGRRKSREGSNSFISSSIQSEKAMNHKII